MFRYELPLVRHFHLARRAGVPALAAAIGALIAAPAFADVSVTPTTAVQGSGENLDFHVTNNGTKPLGTVTLKLPDDTPVAEVYPLSNDRWAPKIQMKTLASPLPTIHGGVPATQATTSITWLGMPGLQLAPGKSDVLSVAIGPLPTLSTMQFTLVTTYADGSPGPAQPPVTLTLTPDTTGQVAAEHAAHGGAAATGSTDGDPAAAAEDAQFAKAVADATRGPSIWSLAGWGLAVLALALAGLYFWRGRHRAEADEDEPADEDEAAAPADTEPAGEKQPVTAGKWSLRP